MKQTKKLKMVGVLTTSLLLLAALFAGYGVAQSSEVIEVIAGSGAEHGVDDAQLIEDALLNCPPGCTVQLYGHFIVDRSIKVTGFSGHIKGQRTDATIIEAVGPFERTLVPIANVDLGVLLWLDEPTGNITIEDLTLQVLDPAPVEPHPNPFIGALQSTALNNLLVIWNPNCACERPEFIIKDVAMRGASSNADGSHNGQNVVYCGIVAPFLTGPVETTVEDSDFAHCGEAAYESWSYFGGSSSFRDNTVSQSHMGIWMAWNYGDVTTTITDNAFVDVDDPIFYAAPPFGTVIVEDNEIE